jgi:hypothetical protein
LHTLQLIATEKYRISIIDYGRMHEMTTIYKLTDAAMQTYGGFQWALGETRTTLGEGELCDEGWLHCYEDKHIGVIMNPIHAHLDPSTMRMFEGIGGGNRLDDHGLKCGYTELTLVKEIDVPIISTEHRVAFAILCAKRVYGNAEWTRWAERWLSGEDRSEAAAREAWDAAWAAVSAAARAADLSAAAARGAAMAAARAVARAADADAAAVVAMAAWDVAMAAAWADRAAMAVEWAADAADLDLVAIFEEARQYVKG